MNEIQKRILELFKAVKEVCDKNKLTYYAIGGTCIGAVRHHGFIPWDDDLDIAVPIEEWDEFWRIMNQELPIEYKIYSGYHIKHYRYVFNKIHDSRTTFIEEAEEKYPDSYKGIFIDVMPIAGLPEDRLERENLYKRIRWLSKLNFMRRYPIREMENNKRKLVCMLLHVLSPFISYHHFSDKWIELLKKYPMKESQFTGYTWWEHISDRLCFPIDCFKDTKSIKFENTHILCPIDSDGYLTRQFGDYKTLPPEDQRQDHHQVYVSTESPYFEFQGVKKRWL